MEIKWENNLTNRKYVENRNLDFNIIPYDMFLIAGLQHFTENAIMEILKV